MTVEARLNKLENMVRVLMTRVASASGVTDHAALNNLAYAASGHTGFAATAHTHDEDDLSLSDNTTNDASTSQHGFLKKLPNTTTTFLRGDGSFAIPPGAEEEHLFFSSTNNSGTLTAEDVTTLAAGTSAGNDTSVYSNSTYDNTKTYRCIVKCSGNGVVNAHAIWGFARTDFWTGSDEGPDGGVCAAFYMRKNESKECVNHGGSSATTTTFTEDISAYHQYKVVRNSTTNIKYYIDNILEATHTTNLPTDALKAGVSSRSEGSNVTVSTKMWSLQIYDS